MKVLFPQRSRPWPVVSGIASVVYIAAFTLHIGASPVQQVQGGPGVALPPVIEFNRDIRPILSENCFTCHGPDKARRVTAFHFDIEESAKQDIGGGRYAIAPGDPEKSVLIQRVTAEDPRRRMPPASTG